MLPHVAVPTPTSPHPDVLISSDHLRARIYLPDADRGFYRSTRFDWSGIVADLEVGGHRFYRPWFTGTDPDVRDFVYRGADIVAGPQSAVTGPAEEFPQPQGYDKAGPDGTFVKVGVGVLRRADTAPYSPYAPYEIVSSGQWRVDHDRDWIECVQTLPASGAGFGYEYRKRIEATPGHAELVIAHTLRNTGRATIDTTQYNHNFLTIDDAGTGPDIVITAPFVMASPEPPDPELAAIDDNTILFRKTFDGEDRFYAPLEGFGADPIDFDFRIEHRRIGAAVRVTGDRPLARLGLWAIRTVVSVEPFVDVTTRPGETTRWTYRYLFSTR